MINTIPRYTIIKNDLKTMNPLYNQTVCFEKMNESQNDQALYLSLIIIMIITLMKFLDFINIKRYQKEIKHQKIINAILFHINRKYRI